MIELNIDKLENLTDAINRLADAFENGAAANTTSAKSTTTTKAKSEKPAKEEPKDAPEDSDDTLDDLTGETLDYNDDVLPHFRKLVKETGAKVAKKVLEKYNVKKGGDVADDDLSNFLDDVKSAIETGDFVE